MSRLLLQALSWLSCARNGSKSGATPLTLRMIIALPVMQLFLFGYAINSRPEALADRIAAVDHSQSERTIVAALQNTGYYDIRPLASEAEAERGLADGELLFVVNIPDEFRTVCRPWRTSPQF